MVRECYFDWKFKCNESLQSKGLINIKAKRIQNIIKCSQLYQDSIHERLQSQFNCDSSLVLQTHKVCVENYLHPKEVQKALKCHAGNTDVSMPTLKRARRSELPKFNFLQHCIYCGEECQVEKDQKIHRDGGQHIFCIQFVRPGHKKSLKQEILDKCDERNDKWASQVRVRVRGAVSDLHAADARDHKGCHVSFMYQKSTSAAINGHEDESLQAVISVLNEDQSQIRNSVELHTLYVENGWCDLSRRFITRLLEYFGDNLIALSCPGIATILAFRSGAAKALRIIPSQDEDDTDIAVNKLKKKICQEVNGISVDRNNYKAHLDYDSASIFASSTLLNLLSCLSTKLDNTLPAVLIGNIITSVLTNHPTQLQISLAVLLRQSKELVKTMNDFGVTCTYDELLRFKKSVAAAAAKSAELTAISKVEDDLVQVVVDNFDADIASQNCKLSTHSLAVLLTQPAANSQHQEHNIPRLKKTEMTKEIDYQLDIVGYSGPKKPKFPPQFLKKHVPLLKTLAHMVLSQQRANENDFAFLTDVIMSDDSPEFNGYNTCLCREQGRYPKPKTKAVYLPLIDIPPAHPDTIMTAMSKAQQLTEKMDKISLCSQLINNCTELP